MSYQYSKDIKLNFIDESKVKEALLNVGFGVLTEINMRELLNLN